MKKAFKFKSLNFYPYLLILPAVLLLIMYLFYPIIYTFIISLTSWSGLVPFGKAIFIGFGNYIELMRDRIFWLSLKNTTMFMLGVLIVKNIIGFTLALALYYSTNKANGVWRAIIFFPAILSSVIVGFVFKFIFAQEGIINDILRLIGLESLARPWLGVPVFPFYVIILVNLWQWSGYNMILYFAGLQNIDESLLEAARLDGANEWHVISKIIIPSLSGVITIVMILNIIGGFKIFDTVYIMTQGGPANTSEVLSTYMFFLSFSGLYNKMGVASAISIVLTIIIFIVSVIRFKIIKEDYS